MSPARSFLPKINVLAGLQLNDRSLDRWHVRFRAKTSREIYDSTFSSLVEETVNPPTIQFQQHLSFSTRKMGKNAGLNN